MGRSSKVAAVFLFLFALPFAGFGLFAVARAVQQIIAGTGGSSAWMLLPFGLVFSAIGLGLIFAALFGSKVMKRQQRRQVEHPAEPWLWRDDWAQGRIQSNTRSGMIGAWIFAVLWNTVSMPILFFLPQQAAKKPIAYLGLIFPIAGILLLVRAIRMTLAYAEFGKTWFEMSAVPGVIGGELKGTILTRFPRSPEHGIDLRLTCVNRTVTGSGDSRSTSEHILWRDQKTLVPGHFYAGPTGTSIPVQFNIPWDARATDTSNPSAQIVWQLEALADVPGVDYHDQFEVPVFRTSQTPAQPEADPVDASVVTRPSALTVIVTPTSVGTEFYFPAARNKGFAVMTTVFWLIFAFATFFLVVFHAPVIFPAAFGLFALLLLYITVQMWFGTTRVGIGPSELLLQDGYCGSGKVRKFAFSEIASISSRITSQQGSGTGTPYYDIELHLVNGRKATLGRTLRSKEEVDWLVVEMQRMTGVRSKAATAATT